ncbi:hypothetical protein [Exiguobacterium flavidum]|uniref:hypothetical protein n=1 Tax=Exiguobacterium flavidum TaxID=2184695 RepID=UPI000DF7415E|nr:hypothetical protein [Exiguobacterium flavidum]
MKIDYFAVMPTGKNGELEPLCLTDGRGFEGLDEEWLRAIHYGAGLIRIIDGGVELRLPVEFGFGYVLQYLRQFADAERHLVARTRKLLRAQLDWISRGLPLRLSRQDDWVEIEGDEQHAYPLDRFLEALGKANASVV